MVKHNRPLATLWEIPDELWLRIEPLLNRLDPPATTGRKREDRRRALDGIIFRLRTGCQWNHVPRVYGDDSTLFRCFQRWCEVGLFAKLWAKLLGECDELRGAQWKWQAADGMLGKARFGGALLAPTSPTAEKGLEKELANRRGRWPLGRDRRGGQCE